jgi:hypothetical protein
MSEAADDPPIKYSEILEVMEAFSFLYYALAGVLARNGQIAMAQIDEHLELYRDAWAAHLPPSPLGKDRLAVQIINSLIGNVRELGASPPAALKPKLDWRGFAVAETVDAKVFPLKG